jgi:hypothetical protein
MEMPHFSLLGVNRVCCEKEPAADYRETVCAIGGGEDDASAQGVQRHAFRW